MDGFTEDCAHLKGLRKVLVSGFQCPTCDARLDMEGVARWVSAAERARDEAYPVVEGDEFGEIVREEQQREVYRRRKVMYELQSASRTPIRPEMLLILYDGREGSYGCRLFYKEPRPVSAIERLDIEASPDAISGLRGHQDPVVRLAAGKVEEFDVLRSKLSSRGEPVPARWVFYASDL